MSRQALATVWEACDSSLNISRAQEYRAFLASHGQYEVCTSLVRPTGDNSERQQQSERIATAFLCLARADSIGASGLAVTFNAAPWHLMDSLRYTQISLNLHEIAASLSNSVQGLQQRCCVVKNSKSHLMNMPRSSIVNHQPSHPRSCLRKHFSSA